MSADEIRQQFLDFFESKSHKIVPSAPIVVKNDPTLMFTNAGMNPFKDIFLGNTDASYPRVADTQRCLRVSGKHNDLDEVGHDTYHHTMFEMLGNWSFGDYFKTEAIAWSWELLVDIFKLPVDRLYVTIFEGSEADGLDADSEAKAEWLKWISEDRIINGNRKDNFWEMGDTGPCGPCSEIHIDLRSQSEINALSGRELVNQSHPQVVEIWNLVFMQFNRMANGELVPLKNKHIDTGMGLERLAMAIQGKKSNYDTDVFQYLIHHLENKFKVVYGQNESTDIALRVISDHIRSITFTIADGQLPANSGAGYEVRKILRRAVRYAYRFLQSANPFLGEMSKLVALKFQTIFPEAFQQKDFIARIIEEEETAFLRTIAQGSRMFEKWIADNPNQTIPGKLAFELYDTFGFPIDLTNVMAVESGVTVDIETFKAELLAQKERSRKDAIKQQGDWMIVADGGSTEFVGYDEYRCETKILRYRPVTAKGKTMYQLVLSKTPFYPEGGGQIGDTGFIQSIHDKIEIVDTKKENDLILHLVSELPEQSKLDFVAQIDVERRRSIEKNHSVTHLVHAALRQVLGSHVGQKGSLVGPDYMRFDFSHFTKMTDAEIREVETIVNQRIRQNLALDEQRSIPIDRAMELGAMALFGEKYGETVRMITFGADYSRELCGGTHVKATGEIGICKIFSEQAVAAGVRRIEVVTGEGAENYIRQQELLLLSIKELLKGSKDVLKSIEQLQSENSQLNAVIDSLRQAETNQLKKQLTSAYKLENDTKYLVRDIQSVSIDQLKNLVYALKNEVEDSITILASQIDGKASVWVGISDSLVEKFDLDARVFIKLISKHIAGGGGGQVAIANAGGKNPSGIAAALNESKEELIRILRSV